MEKSTRRQELEEKYADITFTLLLDELMAEEGEALLAQEAGADLPPVPEALDARCLRTIRRADAKKRRKRFLHGAGRAFSRVAVVFLVVAIAFAVPFCTVSAFRTAALDYVIRTFDSGTDISLYGQSSAEPYAGGGQPTRFPDGTWTLVESARDAIMYVVQYENETGDRIRYSETKAQSTGITVDSENSSIENSVVVKGWPAFVSVRDAQTIIVWMDNDNEIFCTLMVDGEHLHITEEDAVSIAESVR